MLKVLLCSIGQSIYFGYYAVKFWVLIKKLHNYGIENILYRLTSIC